MKIMNVSRVLTSSATDMLRSIQPGELIAYRNKLEARLACPVCGQPLGQKIWLVVLSTEDGGTFRLTCNTVNAGHQSGVKYAMPLDSKRDGYFAIEHYARKRWADPGKLLNVLLPWLQACSW